MRHYDAAPVFAEAIVFPDVDEATLAQEDLTRGAISAIPAPQDGAGAWHDYLRKVLPPLHRQPQLRVLQGGPGCRGAFG